MNTLTYLAMFGFVPAMLVVFATMPARSAVLLTAIGGWLFLPQAIIPVPGFLNLEKYVVIGLALFLGVALFDARSLARVRFGWIDVPMFGWIAAALFSALANDTGVYDGIATAFARVIGALVPYWIGRAYFADPEGVRSLLRACFIGGVVYLAPVAFELRMSPQLHEMFFGYHQHSFEQALRGSGYRPLVFTPHGLALTFWLAVATLSGLALWRSGRLRTLWGIPVLPLVVALAATTVLCKSLGAVLLMLLGAAMLLTARPWLYWATLAACLTYMVARIGASDWVHDVLDVFVQWLPEDRAVSLMYRVDNEELLVDRAWTKPWFGWTPWSFLDPIIDENGESQVIVCDSMWIIFFTVNGFFGLVCYMAMLVIPGALAVREWTVRRARGLDEVVVLAVLLLLFLGDSLVNNFPTPTYVLMMGAVAGGWRAVVAGREVAPAVMATAQPRRVQLLRPASVAAHRGLLRPRTESPRRP